MYGRPPGGKADPGVGMWSIHACIRPVRGVAGKLGTPGHDGMRGTWSQSTQRPRGTCFVRGVPVRSAPFAVIPIVLASSPDAPTGPSGSSLLLAPSSLALGRDQAWPVRLLADHQGPGDPGLFRRERGDRHRARPPRQEAVEPGIAG